MSHADQTVTMGPMFARWSCNTSGVDAPWRLCLSQVIQTNSREDVGRRCCPLRSYFSRSQKSGYKKTWTQGQRYASRFESKIKVCPKVQNQCVWKRRYTWHALNPQKLIWNLRMNASKNMFPFVGNYHFDLILIDFLTFHHHNFQGVTSTQARGEPANH